MARRQKNMLFVRYSGGSHDYGVDFAVGNSLLSLGHGSTRILCTKCLCPCDIRVGDDALCANRFLACIWPMLPAPSSATLIMPSPFEVDARTDPSPVLLMGLNARFNKLHTKHTIAGRRQTGRMFRVC